MTFREWLVKECEKREERPLIHGFKQLFDELVLDDGVQISVQASVRHMCEPHEDLADGSYESVEVYTHGVEMLEFDDYSSCTEFNYFRVPIDVMENFILKHGGIVTNEDDERMINIQEMIDSRKEAGEITNCVLYVSNGNDHSSIDKVGAILDKYGIKWNMVDTFAGSFNLNRDWIETSSETTIPCAVEYCGVYPVNWDIKDVFTLVKLEEEGRAIIMVDWITDDGKRVPNN